MKNIKAKLLVTATAAFICGAVVCLAIKSTAGDVTSAPAQAHWTNHELAGAGYGTPEAALKTLLWSVNNGDGDTFLASFSPEKSAKIAKAWAGKFDEILGKLRSGLKKMTDFQIASEQSGDDETTIDLLSTLGDGRIYDRKFTFKKFGNDWKCDRVFPIPHVEDNAKG